MWIIAGIIVAVLLLTYAGTRIFEGKRKDRASASDEPATVPDADCCGAHEVCDKETLLSADDEIVYYQDEDLDHYQGRSAQSYSSAEIEDFREILYTMRDDEVAGWLRSLQLRNINPPIVIRDEALMIVSEVRDIIRGGRQTATAV